MLQTSLGQVSEKHLRKLSYSPCPFQKNNAAAQSLDTQSKITSSRCLFLIASLLLACGLWRQMLTKRLHDQTLMSMWDVQQNFIRNSEHCLEDNLYRLMQRKHPALQKIPTRTMSSAAGKLISVKTNSKILWEDRVELTNYLLRRSHREEIVVGRSPVKTILSPKTKKMRKFKAVSCRGGKDSQDLHPKSGDFSWLWMHL